MLKAQRQALTKVNSSPSNGLHEHWSRYEFSFRATFPRNLPVRKSLSNRTEGGESDQTAVGRNAVSRFVRDSEQSANNSSPNTTQSRLRGNS